MIGHFPFRIVLIILYGFGFYALIDILPRSSGGGIMFFALVYFGLGLGIAAQLVFDWDREKGFLSVFLNGFFVLCAICIVFVVLAYETLICVAVLLPIGTAAFALGLLLMRLTQRQFERNDIHSTVLLALPVALLMFGPDDFDRSEVVSVTTTLDIAAPAESLRALVPEISPIADSERPWTITHNLLGAPKPLAATTQNGIRLAEWTREITFHEVIFEDTDNSLAWEFEFPDPDAMRKVDPRISPTGPDIEMLTGRYAFEALDDTYTRVSLTTTYRVSSPFNLYLKPWGSLFLNDFHNAVLHVVASRAETAALAGKKTVE